MAGENFVITEKPLDEIISLFLVCGVFDELIQEELLLIVGFKSGNLVLEGSVQLILNFWVKLLWGVSSQTFHGELESEGPKLFLIRVKNFQKYDSILTLVSTAINWQTISFQSLIEVSPLNKES